MLIIENIKSTIKPVEVDDTREDVVYVHSNIVESVEIDPVFNTECIIYTYDEIQYSLPEWNKLAIKELKKKQEEIDKKISEILEYIKK